MYLKYAPKQQKYNTDYTFKKRKPKWGYKVKCVKFFELKDE